MVHLGVGAFHRAHQAVYTDDALEAEGGDWGVIGVSLRSPTAATQLNPQDGLYTVGSRDGATEDRRLIGNLKRVITATDDPAAARAALADPAVRVVTMTITEKGYALDPATGDLLADSPDIVADLANPGRPRSAVGYLVDAIATRRAAGAPAFTPLSCDNLPSNGARLKAALVQYAERLDPALSRFIEAEIACPETMVDRIAPATSEADLDAATAALGVRDDGYVKTEPFKQWVVEDAFSGPRPAWERGGVRFVDDVAAYETAKLRLLNGPHSAIAYLGYLSGHEYVHEVMAEAVLSDYVTGLMELEIAPTVAEPAGMPLKRYAEDLRSRFRNSALQHRTWQIAMDGSQKLPQRLLNTIRERIAQGAPYARLALGVAGWIVYTRGADLAGAAIDVRDPLATRTAAIWRDADGDLDRVVDGYLRLDEVFGDDLSRNADVAGLLRGKVHALLNDGIHKAAAAIP